MAAVLTLASQSPRRAELLQQLGVNFVVRPANIDESPLSQESPLDYVQRMAREKTMAVMQTCDGYVLGADTTVVIDGDSLGKPADDDDARAMLARLSGKTHTVMTAICVFGKDGIAVRCVETAVQFSTLSADIINAYIASGEPRDKAGAYGIQGLAGTFVRRINGSYSNVVGLPLVETRELLESAGLVTGLAAGSATGVSGAAR